MLGPMPKIPPQLTPPAPKKPFESENVTAEEKRYQLELQRKSSGNLTDDPQEAEAQVQNKKPFRART